MNTATEYATRTRSVIMKFPGGDSAIAIPGQWKALKDLARSSGISTDTLACPVIDGDHHEPGNGLRPQASA